MKSPLFSLQRDETPDISQHSKLLFYYKFVDDKQFMEAILFYQTLEMTTKVIDVFSALSNF